MSNERRHRSNLFGLKRAGGEFLRRSPTRTYSYWHKRYESICKYADSEYGEYWTRTQCQYCTRVRYVRPSKIWLKWIVSLGTKCIIMYIEVYTWCTWSPNMDNHKSLGIEIKYLYVAHVLIVRQSQRTKNTRLRNDYLDHTKLLWISQGIHGAGVYEWRRRPHWQGFQQPPSTSSGCRRRGFSSTFWPSQPSTC